MNSHQDTSHQDSGLSSLTVLMPAHNEEQGIAVAIRSVQSQEGVDRIIVVADTTGRCQIGRAAA